MRRALPILKTLPFTVLVPGVVAGYVPRRILLSRRETEGLAMGLWRPLGLAMIAAGAAAYLWCAWDFATAGQGTPAPIDPPRRLVARGLYRRVRNPMYVGVALVLLGEALLFRSRVLLEYAAAVLLFFHLFIVFYEEPALARGFGESYEQYRATVPRWIPRIGTRRSADRKSGAESQAAQRSPTTPRPRPGVLRCLVSDRAQW